MKLHTVFFTVMAVLILKLTFGFTWVVENGGDGPNDNSVQLFLLIVGILVSFMAGGIAYSFDWDKRNGVTATRDACTILGIFILVTKFPLIVGFVVALGFTIANHRW